LIAARLGGYEIAIDGRHLDAGIDMIVRLVLSHVTHPSGLTERTADDLAWIVGRALRP